MSLQVTCDKTVSGAMVFLVMCFTVTMSDSFFFSGNKLVITEKKKHYFLF